MESLGALLSNSAKKLDHALFGPIESIRLRVFEVTFTLTFLVYFLARFSDYREWLCGEGFHYSADAKLSYLPDSFAPLEPWAAWVLFAFVLIAVGMVVWGKCIRCMCAALFIISICIQYIDFSSAFALNKLYIVGFLLLLVSPPVVRGENDLLVRKSAWSFRILQLTLCCQILHAGLFKLLQGGDWHISNDVIWSHAQGIYRTELAAWSLRMLPMWAWSVLQFGALGFELVGPFLLPFRKTAAFGLLGGLGFVLFIGTMMNDLVYFMLQMAAFFTLFVPPGWIERAKDLLLRRNRKRVAASV